MFYDPGGVSVNQVNQFYSSKGAIPGMRCSRFLSDATSSNSSSSLGDFILYQVSVVEVRKAFFYEGFELLRLERIKILKVEFCGLLKLSDLSTTGRQQQKELIPAALRSRGHHTGGSSTG